MVSIIPQQVSFRIAINNRANSNSGHSINQCTSGRDAAVRTSPFPHSFIIGAAKIDPSEGDEAEEESNKCSSQPSQKSVQIYRRACAVHAYHAAGYSLHFLQAYVPITTPKKNYET